MLIDDINDRIGKGEVTQDILAKACGITQGHLSKILSGTVSAGPKSIRALKEWLAQNPKENDATELVALARAIRKKGSRQKKAVMQIMQSVLALLD